ncbi:MAG: hypothetical protein HUJ61_00445 [Bacilli bacterium]|nr:hypothetical protein [Bacilli bacterium]
MKKLEISYGANEMELYCDDPRILYYNENDPRSLYLGSYDPKDGTFPIYGLFAHFWIGVNVITLVKTENDEIWKWDQKNPIYTDCEEAVEKYIDFKKWLETLFITDEERELYDYVDNYIPIL